MAFAPTPPRNSAPSQLFSLGAILSATGGSTGGNTGVSASVALTNPPLSGSVGAGLSLVGTVAPAGSAVRVGLSTSAGTAPTGWISATVSGAGWTASLVPSAAGTYYIWAEQTAAVSVQTVSAAITVSASGGLAITSQPATGTVGTALSLTGTVSPSGAAVQVGLSTSATTAPSSWTNATVSGSNWTASLTPSAVGTYYIWAEQTSATSLQAVSPVVTVSAAGGSVLSYSLISGSGNGSLAGITVVSLTSQNYPPSPAVDWTTSLAVGAADVMPGILPSSLGSITACKFWFDSSATNTTVPAVYGNQASLSNGAITFYPFNDGYGTPTCVPAAPSTAGTYYGKYALYNSSSTLLGVFVTSAITVH